MEVYGGFRLPRQHWGLCLAQGIRSARLSTPGGTWDSLSFLVFGKAGSRPWLCSCWERGCLVWGAWSKMEWGCWLWVIVVQQPWSICTRKFNCFFGKSLNINGVDWSKTVDWVPGYFEVCQGRRVFWKCDGVGGYFEVCQCRRLFWGVPV